MSVIDIQSEDGFRAMVYSTLVRFPVKAIFAVLVIDDGICGDEECNPYFNSGYFYADYDDADPTWWVYRRDAGDDAIQRTLSTDTWGEEITLTWDAYDVSPRAGEQPRSGS